jgi:4-amino-4-deoxy-L-arabinose transferase-like glycosyltransferase
MLCLIMHENSYRQAFLGAAICFGILLAAITELLSLFTAISYISLLFCWGGIIFIVSIYLQRHWDSARFAPPKLESPLMLIGIAYILATTLLIALVSPPNNFDSMTYHMARVVHWIQNGSVAHYPTHITRQLYSSPGAEYAIMHLQILGGGDLFANLVQWFAMCGSIIGTSLIAKEFGASNRIQVLTAVLTATVPMGILQATSTQNDLVVAFWLVSFVYFGNLLIRTPAMTVALACGGSLGLAILTKGSAYIFAFPLLLWLLGSGLTAHRRRFIKPIIVAGVIAISLNAGHYWRNYALWGNPLATDGEKLTNDHITIRATVSNLTRNIASHTWTPIPSMNNLQFQGVAFVHEFLGIELSDPATSFNEVIFSPAKTSMDEDYAGNGLHLLLVLVSIVALILRRKSLPRAMIPYALSLAAGFLLYCMLLKWQPWGTRLQLPLFVLASPLTALALPFGNRSWAVSTMAAIMLFCSTPWLFGNQTRPLWGYHSILSADRESLYFAKRSQLQPYYSQAAEYFSKPGSCESIGLVSSNSNTYEYPLWALLDRDRKEMPRIEHINVNNISGSIPLKNFRPCAELEIH